MAAFLHNPTPGIPFKASDLVYVPGTHYIYIYINLLFDCAGTKPAIGTLDERGSGKARRGDIVLRLVKLLISLLLVPAASQQVASPT